MHNVKNGYATLGAIALALAGCSRNADPANQTEASSRPSDPATNAVPDPMAVKLGGYTSGYNKLIDTFGLTETAKSYRDENIGAKSPSDSISVTDGWLPDNIATLKKARALPGGAAPLDQAADRLIGSLDKVVARLSSLKIYYDAKSYKEDGLARGKREDPLMRAEFAAALEALDAFNVALKVERDKQQERDLAALKASGNMLGYDTKRALQQGEQLVDLFGTAEDLRNPALLARGDAVVASLEATLADQRRQFASAKAKAAADAAPDGDYDSVAGALTSMIGEYRDIKQSHEVDDLNAMVKEYNRAVDSANSIED